MGAGAAVYMAEDRSSHRGGIQTTILVVRCRGAPLQFHQYHAHRVQGAMKRIEYEAEVLERHDTEQGLRVAGFAEDDWCVPLALREREMALGDRPRNRCPVRERELLVATGRQTDASPDGVGQQRIHRAGINEELDAFSARRPADGSFDVADAHLPGYGLPIIAPSTSLELSPRLADPASARRPPWTARCPQGGPP